MSPRTRTLISTGVLVAAVVGVGTLGLTSIYSSAATKQALRTVTVQRGTVQATVSSSGNVQARSALAVNFQTGGTLTAIEVKPGDQVVAGQPLATIDASQVAASLAAAQASLNAAQANLASVERGLTPAAAAANQAALVSSQQQVASAQVSLSDAEQTASFNLAGYQNAVNRAGSQLQADQSACQANPASPACKSVGPDNNAVANATQQQASGVLKDQQSLHQAQNSLASAQDGLATTEANNAVKAEVTPAAVAQAQSTVAQAQANLVTAQRTMAYTTLTAPVAGTVAVVNGVVGQTVSGGGSAAASASGTSSTSSGGGGGSSTSASTGSSSSASSSSSSSSSPLVTLEDLSGLQVVAGFAEADASQISVRQPASVSLNALPSTQVSGSVSEIDLSSTVVSNVVTYNVRIDLTNPPPTVKPGMTANADVVVAHRDGVLNVPTADVTTRGSLSTVTVMQNGKQVTQIVSTGLKGDQTTEITAGLTEGEVIVQPAATTTSASPTLRFGGTGGIGGLGGSGIGGGATGGGRAGG